MGRYDDEVYKIIQGNSDLTFSKDDIALGRDNIEAFKGITQAKRDWLNSNTTAGQKAANDRANAIRQAYGGYNGGAEGLNGTYKSPAPTFEEPEAGFETSRPDFTFDDYNDKYNNGYTFDRDDYFNEIVNSFDGERPEYTSKYEDTLDSLLDQIINQEDFEYDMNADPLYQQYRDQYIREGQRAMRDTIGGAAAATGGYGSSYSAMAGQQAYDNYLSQLNDRVPQLEQYAYDKYRDSVADVYNQLNATQGLEQYYYNQYLNDLQQYNTDRNFYADAAIQAQAAQNQWNNYVLDLYNTDLNQYNNDRNWYQTEREWQNAIQQQEFDNQQTLYNNEQNELNRYLEYAANMGDYDAISSMLGVDTDTAKELMEQSLESGRLGLAEQQLGITNQELINAAQEMANEMDRRQLAEMALGTSGNGGSGSRSGGNGKDNDRGDEPPTPFDEYSTPNSFSEAVSPLMGLTNNALGYDFAQTNANRILDDAVERFETEEGFDAYIASLIRQGRLTQAQYNNWLNG